MESKTWVYVGAVAALLLVVGAVAVYLTTGSAGVAGGIGTAAAAATAKALQERQKATQKAVAAKQEALVAQVETKHDKEEADTDIKKVPVEVAAMSDEEKKAEGESLFGGANTNGSA